MYAIIYYDGSIYMEDLTEDEAADRFDEVTRYMFEDE